MGFAGTWMGASASPILSFGLTVCMVRCAFANHGNSEDALGPVR